MPNHKLTAHREAADRISQNYRAAVAEVQEDRDLSNEGRQRRLADLYVDARRRLTDLAQKEKAELDSRRTALENQFFGARGAGGGWDTASHAISARDASDRAAQIKTPAEAAELLERANADGDELLARAVARRSVRASEQAVGQRAVADWDAVSMTYLDARPRLLPVAEELGQIENMSKREVFSPFSLSKPAGLDPAALNVAAVNKSSEPVEA
ncbi:hypothetical protein ENKNEFLB_01945 [Nocardioides aquaticus]|uniref:Uncharacterized protein n=2 Tax=Nocardioides aquaticus TaxID=160826 RepID=A0ABX8EKE5_9ACTN|nr:hypothetical protein ENKNEFLB_01945 [Nocardioides aquaticus]